MMKILVMIMLSLAMVGFSFGEALVWGVNGHPMNQASYFTMPLARQLEHVRELGASWYRFGASFHDLRANASRLDELVREADQRGVRLLPVLLSDLIWEESSTPEQIFEEAREPNGTVKNAVVIEVDENRKPGLYEIIHAVNDWPGLRGIQCGIKRIQHLFNHVGGLRVAFTL